MNSEPEKAGEPFKIFLSYASEDREEGQKIGDYLCQYLNARVFMPDSLSLGESWKNRLRDAISESKLFVMVFSPHWLESSWVRQELGAAWALEKPVLSVSTEPHLTSKLPVELERVNSIELKDLENPAELDRVIQVLLNLPGERRRSEDKAETVARSEEATEEH